MEKIIAVLEDASLQVLSDVLYAITVFFQQVNMQTGIILTNEYFKCNRLDFSNYVKNHVIIMFSDQQFVDINKDIHSPQVQAQKCHNTCRKHTFWMQFLPLP